MPLSAPDPRDPLHVRTVECRGFRRADGLWDIEGRIVDTKAYAFDNRHRGTVQPGEAVHDMSVRLTVDENLLIHAAEAVSDFHPYPDCAAIEPNYGRLAGLRIGPGWMEEVKKRVGGVEGCTHIFELLRPVATTAYQTVFPTREKRESANPTRKRPAIIDTCHTLRSDGEAVRHEWPQFYTGDSAA